MNSVLWDTEEVNTGVKYIHMVMRRSVDNR